MRNFVLGWHKHGRLPSRPVYCVVPVYGVHPKLEECLRTILENAPHDAEVIIWDDGSHDESLNLLLESLAAEHDVTIARNARNIGFTKTVNRALRRYRAGDVVLINSDVFVPRGLIQGLRRTAHRSPEIAAVSPLFSDSSEFGLGSATADGDLEGDSRAVARAGLLHECFEAPTIHGAVVYLKREAVQSVGLLDDVSFPRGYGEENDWSCRARDLGWKVVVDYSLLAGHIGQASFGRDKSELLKNAVKELRTKHPSYHSDVAKWLPNHRNQMETIRKRIRYCRNKVILHVIHSGEGGAHRLMRDLASAMPGSHHLQFSADSENLFLHSLRADNDRLIWIRQHSGKVSLEENDDVYRKSFLNLLQDYRPDLVLVHGMINHDWRLFSWASDFGVRLGFHIHDFYSVCPSYNLIDENGAFCGGTCTVSKGSCNAVIPHTEVAKIAPPLKHEFVYEWRQIVERSLVHADVVTSPSDFASGVFRLRFPALAGKVRKMVYPPSLTAVTNSSARICPRSGTKKVLLLGNINEPKGLLILEDLLRTSNSEEFQFFLAGKTSRPVVGLNYLGAYEIHSLRTLVANLDPDLGAVLSSWGETYSYVLSELLTLSVPTLVSPRGALRERWPHHLDDSSGLALIESLRRATGSKAAYKKLCSDAQKFGVEYVSEAHLEQVLFERDRGSILRQ